MLTTKSPPLNQERHQEAPNVRESLAELGKSTPIPVYTCLQSSLTWLTGKPYQGQKPLFRSSKSYELTTAIASLFSSAIASAFIFNSAPIWFPLLVPSWLVTVGAARKIQTCIIHRCVHYLFWGDERDRILAEVLSTLLFIQNFDGYRHDHVKCHHHAAKFATFEGDPDAKFMLRAGFHPGLKDEDK